MAAQGRRFNDPDQNQRGALAILDGRVYVPYGGHFGDCGSYHGWVVGVGLTNPAQIVAWSTRAPGGGIWAPGGIASDGHSLFVATGNTMDARRWSDGEAVFRLAPDLARSTRPQDYFAPSDWRALDASDADLGGTNPLPLDVPAATGTQPLILALGKDCARLPARPRQSRRHRRQPLKRDGRHRPDPHRGVGLSSRRRRLCRVRGTRARIARRPAAAMR